MRDNRMSEEILEEKTKVESIEIIVEGTKEQPYYEIKYKKVGSDYYCIGYGSYYLECVFEWKEQCFELVEQEKTVHNVKLGATFFEDVKSGRES